MSATTPTPAESGLAQAYVETLDVVGRCAEDLADGDWRSLAERAGQLRTRVESFEEAADEAGLQIQQRPRADVVLAEVAERGRGDRAVALLHPDTGQRPVTGIPAITPAADVVSPARERAVTLLTHYLRTAFEASRVTWTSEHSAEIRQLVMLLIEATDETLAGQTAAGLAELGIGRGAVATDNS